MTLWQAVATPEFGVLLAVVVAVGGGASGGKVLPSGRVPPMIAESFYRCRGCLQCRGCLHAELEVYPPKTLNRLPGLCQKLLEAQATLAERQVGDGKGCCWDGVRLQKFGEAACDGVIMGMGEGFGGTGR